MIIIIPTFPFGILIGASHLFIEGQHPEKSRGMLKSLLLMAEQGGWLPIFPCCNSYTSAMIGHHVISLIADGYVKDFRFRSRAVFIFSEKCYSIANRFQGI